MRRERKKSIHCVRLEHIIELNWTWLQILFGPGRKYSVPFSNNDVSRRATYSIRYILQFVIVLYFIIGKTSKGLLYKYFDSVAHTIKITDGIFPNFKCLRSSWL